MKVGTLFLRACGVQAVGSVHFLECAICPLKMPPPLYIYTTAPLEYCDFLGRTRWSWALS